MQVFGKLRDRERTPMPRRVFVYALLFLMTGISYLDRVNLSVAAGPLAKQMGLSPVELGWLFSGFLWTYIIFLVPAGWMADRFGFRVIGALAITIWSLATAATGAAAGLVGLAASRFVLGAGEAAAWPVGVRAVRAWAPRSEYGVAVASISLGQSAGGAFGAFLVGWLVRDFGWRTSFAVTGVLGLIWAAVWLIFVRDPARTGWLGAAEREMILATRDQEVQRGTPSSVAKLLASRALWGTMLGQGCLVYGYYMLLTWLPSYLQSQRHIAVFGSGADTAIIYGAAVIGGLVLGRATDHVFTVDALRRGARKTAVVLSVIPAILMATTPWLPSIWSLVLVLAIAVTFLANAISLNAALCNDLVLNPADSGKAIGIFTCGANVIGVTAPIVTGYLVGASKQFDAAFLLTGVVLALGAVILLVVVRGNIGPAAGPTDAPALRQRVRA
jgi:ACS family glucarate transporter-like MFS transporter